MEASRQRASSPIVCYRRGVTLLTSRIGLIQDMKPRCLNECHARQLMSTMLLSTTAAALTSCWGSGMRPSRVRPDVLLMNEVMHSQVCERSERDFQMGATTLAAHGPGPAHGENDATFPSQEEKVEDLRQYHSFPGAGYSGIDATPPPPFKSEDLARVSTKALISPAQCQAMIQEAEDHVESWVQPSRIASYAKRAGATCQVTDLPRTLTWVTTQLLPTLLPAAVRAFPRALEGTPLHVRDARLVKYDAAAGQVELGAHRDGPLLTATLALNDPAEFDGGGTQIEALRQFATNDGDADLLSPPPPGEALRGGAAALRPAAGHAVLHPGNVRHGGAAISRGVRYVLVIFLFDPRDTAHAHCCVLRGNHDLAAALRSGGASGTRGGGCDDAGSHAARRSLLVCAASSYIGALRLGAGAIAESAHLGLGQALLELGKRRASIGALEAALARAPANAHARAMLAKAQEFEVKFRSCRLNNDNGRCHMWARARGGSKEAASASPGVGQSIRWRGQVGAGPAVVPAVRAGLARAR